MDILKLNDTPADLVSLAESIPGCRVVAYSGPPNHRYQMPENFGFCFNQWTVAVAAHSLTTAYSLVLVEEPPTTRKLRICDRFLGSDIINFSINEEFSFLSELALPYVYFAFLMRERANGWDLVPGYVKSFWRKSKINELSDILYPSFLMNTFGDGTVCIGDFKYSNLDLAGQIEEFINFYWESRFTSSLTDIFETVCSENKPFENLSDWIVKTETDPEFILKEEWPFIELFGRKNVAELVELLP